MIKFLVLAITLLATPVFAQSQLQCVKREVALTRLAQVFGETRRNTGLISGKAVMELFTSDATGTWTITITLPNGATCLVASGQSFEEVVGETAPPNL